MKNVQIDYADIRGVMVTCPSFLQCNFARTPHMGGAVFLAHGSAYPMSRPPVYIQGTPMSIILLDEHIMLGETLVLHHNQLGLSRHCLMDLARDSKLPPEELLQTLWAALRERNLHVPNEARAA